MSQSLNREKLLSLFDDNQKGVIYLKGAEVMYRYGTDYEFPFRQESNFWYLTGVNEPEYHAVIDLKTGEYHLFSPRRDARFAVWHGKIRGQSEIREHYQPDHLHFSHELLSLLRSLQPERIYCLDEAQAEYLEDLSREFSVDTETLARKRNLIN